MEPSRVPPSLFHEANREFQPSRVPPSLFREANREFQPSRVPPSLFREANREFQPSRVPPSLFRELNREFELGDGAASGCAEPAARPDSPGLGTSRGRRPAEAGGGRAALRRCPEPQRPPAALVAQAVRELERLMGEFGVDLAAATQALLKNSGDAAAAASCLRTGRRADGRPLWNRRDDEELLRGREGARSSLEAKYGAENVNKRLLFRRSLGHE